MPFNDPDLLLVTGGDLYSSDYGTNSLSHFVAPAIWAKAKGIPCVLLGQSVGRFNSDVDISLWRKAADCSNIVSLREELSRHYLINELKSNCTNIVVTADTGFLLEPNCDYVENCDWFKNSNVVAVSISESICRWTNSDYEKHIENWKAVIRHMINEWDVKVAVIPHVQESFSDDRLLSTRIARELGFDRRVRVFAEDLTAAEFKGIISKCQFVVAERMHAAIASFSSGVCTVPIGYSIKAEGITEMMIRGSDYIASEVSMSLTEFLDLERAIARLDNFWKGRRMLSGVIASNLPGVVSSAERNFELIDQCLKIRGSH
jgi:colanic acid/amylovoran biosynthesis protein